ncbi:GntP family permease [Crateriforma conspicua]|uniref:High-affinity gluconate transporter n=1 Tax=Crateriforma conspicua TaxID=2527996 RepID=A0A5C6FL31_9PLAN|nr:SLC13 family permease [Crateriforma conspicua]TWU61852.1 High-affinity gluconate transporter [Crateriforma conspicua]
MPLIYLLIVVVALLLAVGRYKVHPLIALLMSGLTLGCLCGVGAAVTVDLLMQGFADTLKWIAVVMVFGAIIGEITSETGGAQRIAAAAVRIAGPKHVCPAMGVTGYIVSIPVFVDIAYIMMCTVTTAVARRSGRSVLSVGLSLAAGLTATHALMPPTPGPLAVAGILDASLGRVIVINAVVAFCAMSAGVWWAATVGGRVSLASDPSNGDSRRADGAPDPSSGTRNDQQDHVQDVNGQDVNASIPWSALLPIVVPLVLISVRSFLPVLDDASSGASLLAWSVGAFEVLGLPLVALTIGVALAMLQYGRDFSMARLAAATERGIEKSAAVIMITGAGGAFGHVIKNAGVTEWIAQAAPMLGTLGWLLPFFLAAIFTTATGSITVSMVTTAGVVAPLVASIGVSPEMAAALIGSGAFCVFHVNSSFFWLLNRLHDAPPAVLLRTYTTQSLCMGLGGLAAVGLMRLCGLR